MANNRPTPSSGGEESLKGQSLSAHDRQHHPEGFDPKNDTCKFRDALNEEEVGISELSSSEASPSGLKQAQLEIILRTNPMHDDVHTGIRTIEDIKSFEEAIEAEPPSYPDITKAIIDAAKVNGEIGIYSSKPIKDGVFVSPSKMCAMDYAGGGKVYYTTLPLTDIAWINGDEGQVAEVGKQGVEAPTKENNSSQGDKGISGKRTQEYRRLMAKKHPELDADIIIEELAKIKDKKIQADAFAWVMRGAVRLPEDLYKIEQARELATKAKKDPLAYETPQACINELLGEGHKIKAKAITVEELKSNPLMSDYRDEGYGVETFRVDNSQKGQALMREIIDTHWGEDANPWCLLARVKSEDEQDDEAHERFSEWWGSLSAEEKNRYGDTDIFSDELDDEPNDDAAFAARDRAETYYFNNVDDAYKSKDADLRTAWHYWKDVYNSLPKRVAFKDGELLAFMATDDYGNPYWRAKDWHELDDGKWWVEWEKAIADGKYEASMTDYMEEFHPDVLERYDNQRQHIDEQWWDRQDRPHKGIPLEDGEIVEGEFKSYTPNSKTVQDELVEALMGEADVEDELPQNQTLQEHDRRHHPDGYHEGDTCKYRDKIKETTKEDKVDEIDADKGIRVGGSEGAAITPKEDAEYMEVVKNGDMETAQRMVREAAKERGYEVFGLHGTKGEFTVFDKKRIGTANDEGWLGRGFYFWDKSNRTYAEQYANGGKVMEVMLSMEEPYLIDKAEMERLIDAAERHDIKTLENFSNEVKANGYDSVIDGDGQMLVFEPNQIKSADPVTYDDMGDVIPLSRRFDTGDDIRGDVLGNGSKNLKARKLSAERKEKNSDKGQKSTAITPKEDEQYEKMITGLDSLEQALKKIEQDRKALRDNLFAKHISVDEYQLGVRALDQDEQTIQKGLEKGEKKLEKMIRTAASKIMPNTKAVGKDGLPLVLFHGTISKDKFNTFREGDIFAFRQEPLAKQYTSPRRDLWVSPTITGRVMPIVMNLENPYIVDGKKHLWRNIDVDWSPTPVSTEDICKYARENGYDGVIVKQVRDNMFDNDRMAGDEYIAFSPTQVKALGGKYEKVMGYGMEGEHDELVSRVGGTYDDNGKLIPLSQRFDSKNADIRYAKKQLENGSSIADEDAKGELKSIAKKVGRFIPGVRVNVSDVPNKDGKEGTVSFRNESGKVVGTYNRKTNEITLYPGANADTIGHELCGHAAYQYAEQLAKKGDETLLNKINEVVDAPEAKPIWDEVAINYESESPEVQREEVWAHIIGHKTSKAIEAIKATEQGQKWYNRFWGVVKDAWKGLMSAIGFNKAIDKDIGAMSPEEFSNYMVNQMTEGRTLGELGKDDKGGERKSIIGKKGAAKLGIGKLDEAEKMEKEGVERKEIWKKTGWWKGKDGRWRFEIPDVSPKYGTFVKSLDNAKNKGNGKIYLGEIIDSKELFGAYPELQNTEVLIREELPNGASGSAGYNNIKITSKLLTDEKHLHSVFAHEIQHLIQLKEDFALGGSKSQFKQLIPPKFAPFVQKLMWEEGTVKARDIVDKIKSYSLGEDDKLSKGSQELLSEYAKENDRDVEGFLFELAESFDEYTPYQQYRRLGGEVEARNVQHRLNMSDDEKRESPPMGN